ncbi:hypothetical protein D9757_012089 [Collybiopsis confluens]|uniref:Uncharacterized protein n=1 Tax=Collybiopsis confluens TaxID=2823264 RepID=A0A8H5FXT0_9AGAR|nr:hypothetical protein D9757_012089 [Collybiopsis confluens]
MVAKHSKSQNGEEFPATSSSALDARIYQTAPNYTSSQYFQRHSQAPTLSSVMPRYSNNYSATWSTPTLPVHSYSSLSGYSDTSPNNAHPHRYSSYPPALHSAPSTYSSYPPSNHHDSSWTPSHHLLPDTQSLSSPYASSSPFPYSSSGHSPIEYNEFQYAAHLQRPPSAPHSISGSNEVMLSPYSNAGSLPHSASPSSTPPVEFLRNYSSSGGEDEPPLHRPRTSTSRSPARDSQAGQFSHQEQLQLFRDALNLPSLSAVGPFIPQQMYRPHTNSDWRRYVEEVNLDAPIYFCMDNPSECGISLSDALHSRVRRLLGRDHTVFEGRGPSVSIRLEWPGYRQWSRQIPTKDFRTPPGPITKAKLAKNVAKCVQRFIQERQNHSSEAESDSRWQVGHSGTAGDCIKLEDLILVSMHHVSMGSWQPQLRLARPLLT